MMWLSASLSSWIEEIFRVRVSLPLQRAAVSKVFVKVHASAMILSAGEADIGNAKFGALYV